eukprot:scaffold7511_cov103-Isochrysis_galbana.AAC.2
MRHHHPSSHRRPLPIRTQHLACPTSPCADVNQATVHRRLTSRSTLGASCFCLSAATRGTAAGDGVIDAHSKGNLARFANHSDQANCDSRIVSVRGDQHIAIYAKRSIQRGEEIFFNYRYSSEQRQKHGFPAARATFKPSKAEIKRRPNKGNVKRQPVPLRHGHADRPHTCRQMPALAAGSSSAASSSASVPAST